MTMIFCPGEWSELRHTWQIPDIGTTPMALEVRMKIGAVSLAGLDEIRTVLVYRVRGPDESTLGPIKRIPKKFTVADALTTNKWRVFRYIVGKDKFVGKGGGMIVCWWHYLPTSTGSEFFVDEFHSRRWFAEPMPLTDAVGFVTP